MPNIVVFSLSPLENLVLALIGAAVLFACWKGLEKKLRANQGLIRQPTIRTWLLFSLLFAIPFAVPTDSLFDHGLGENRLLARVLFCLGSIPPLVATMLVSLKCHERLIVPFCFTMRSVWSLFACILACGGGDQPWTSILVGSMWPECVSICLAARFSKPEHLRDFFFASAALIVISLLFDILYGRAGVWLARTCRVRAAISWIHPSSTVK